MTGTDYENGYIIINDAKIVEAGEGDNYLKNELYIKHIDNGKTAMRP